MPVRMAIIKSQETTDAGEDVEKYKCFYTAGGSVNYYIGRIEYKKRAFCVCWRQGRRALGDKLPRDSLLRMMVFSFIHVPEKDMNSSFFMAA